MTPQRTTTITGGWVVDGPLCAAVCQHAGCPDASPGNWQSADMLAQQIQSVTKGERMDGDDMTYENLFKVQPEPDPWPERTEARLAALEARVRQLETLVHRLLNAGAAQEDAE